ncbi:MAG: NAD(P)/FAD-dependent oxidoreductase, partial [Planctomycetota bacterium]|nr:NAD(P)/FAD-dependent oxidoreductase [Planctomycetota bacterium]
MNDRLGPSETQQPPHVVILGGGFAGLTCAKRLHRAPVRITLYDRQNHHCFQPLLYQVATASLSPSDISAPLRNVLKRQKNATVLVGEAESVDPDARLVYLRDGDPVCYDYLVIATGATHSYFGHDQWASFAPGLKTMGDAIELRQRFLIAFEEAERQDDPEARRAALTFVVVGAGPTGVELAGAMAEIARRVMPREFRRIDTTSARILLLEGMDRVLPGYPKDLSERARRDLEQLGVTVWLNTRVTGVDARGVEIGSERIDASNVIWAAGVKGSGVGATLGAETDKAGRVKVAPDLTAPNHPEVFVVGDLAAVTDPRSGKEVPGIAPAALQMGKHVAGIIKRETRGRSRPADREAFHYVDKGYLATIGRARAVA